VDRQKEIRRWSWRLRDLMREAGRTQRSVEQEAGWGKGYLTQVLGEDRPALKVEHVVTILDLLGASLEDFFSGLYNLHPGPGAAGLDTAAVERMIDRRLEDLLSAEREERQRQLERLRAEIQRLRAGDRRRTPQEVREAVEKALSRELQRLAESAAKGGKKKPRPKKRPLAEPAAPREESNGGDPE
jgi:transcriptional regulator with XRE-family HTH domain